MRTASCKVHSIRKRLADKLPKAPLINPPPLPAYIRSQDSRMRQNFQAFPIKKTPGIQENALLLRESEPLARLFFIRRSEAGVVNAVRFRAIPRWRGRKRLFKLLDYNWVDGDNSTHRTKQETLRESVWLPSVHFRKKRNTRKRQRRGREIIQVDRVDDKIFSLYFFPPQKNNRCRHKKIRAYPVPKTAPCVQVGHRQEADGGHRNAERVELLYRLHCGSARRHHEAYVNTGFDKSFAHLGYLYAVRLFGWHARVGHIIQFHCGPSARSPLNSRMMCGIWASMRK